MLKSLLDKCNAFSFYINNQNNFCLLYICILTFPYDLYSLSGGEGEYSGNNVMKYKSVKLLNCFSTIIQLKKQLH